MRLDKFVSDSMGITRKESKEIIKKGLVTLRGAVQKDPGKNISADDNIQIDGKNAEYKQYIYIMMNKPQGVISATDDKRQKTVLDLLPSNYARYNLFPAGRLDIDTEGFLLLTNDGQTAHDLLSPKKKVPKEYLVHLARPLASSDADKIRLGVDIGDYTTKPCTLTMVSDSRWIIKITEGKFHQVKRMFESAGNQVVYLKRISFGGLELDPSLSLGNYRLLTPDEVNIIKKRT